MSAREDVEAIKAALLDAEADQKRARRSLRRVHGLLRQGLLDHGAGLGLETGEVQLMAGTPKPDDPEP